MLVYGAANLVQDLWHEQVVKRGWTSSDVPSVIVADGVRDVGARARRRPLVVYALGFARRARRRRDRR